MVFEVHLYQYKKFVKTRNKNPNFSLNKYLRENVKKGMEVKFHIDKDGTKPTGWIDSSKIVNSIEKEENQKYKRKSVLGIFL